MIRMIDRKVGLTAFLVLNLLSIVLAQQTSSPAIDSVIYKKIDGIELGVKIYAPASISEGELLPAMIFFHGGGWNGGSPSQFEEQAKYFSSRGMVCFLPEYRLKNKHQTTPFEALQDAKSAIRFIKANGAEFHIDTSRIVAAGGSAGGHLAVAASVINGYNGAQDDLAISAKTSALVLFNPVFDNGPGGYGYERIGEAYRDFSPLHNLKKGVPPTLLLFGDEDQLVPVATIRYYQLVMEKIGSRCDVELYPGQKHAFFNYNNREYYNKTVIAVDKFLESLGYIHGKPTLNID